MKYLKRFEDAEYRDEYTEDRQSSTRIQWGHVDTALNIEQFNEVRNMLKKTLDILGIKFTCSNYSSDEKLERQRVVPVVNVFPKNIHYFKVTFEICFTEIKNSILDVLSKTITPNKHIIAKYKEYCDEEVSVVILCEVDVENASSIFCTINPKTVKEGYNLLLLKLIEIMESTTDIIKVGTEYEAIEPIFKTTVINYIKNVLSKEHLPSLFGDNIDIVTEEKLYKDIYTYLASCGFDIFNKIKLNNKSLYNKLMTYNKETSTAAEMGGLGFE